MISSLIDSFRSSSSERGFLGVIKYKTSVGATSYAYISVVESRGLEPLTYSMPLNRSTN